MKKTLLHWKALGTLAFGGLALLIPGCKSAPDLTQAQALAMVQAKYDQTAPVGVNILVNDPGMRQGTTTKLWNRTKVYPNKLWADFKLDSGREESGATAGWRGCDPVAASESR